MVVSVTPSITSKETQPGGGLLASSCMFIPKAEQVTDIGMNTNASWLSFVTVSAWCIAVRLSLI